MGACIYVYPIFVGQVVGPLNGDIHTYMHGRMYVYPIFRCQVAWPLNGDIHIYMHGCMYICISHLHGSSSCTLEDEIYIYTCMGACIYVCPIFKGQVTGPLKMERRLYPEKLATNYQSTLHNMPEGRRWEKLVSAYKFQELSLLLPLLQAFNFFYFYKHSNRK